MMKEKKIVKVLSLAVLLVFGLNMIAPAYGATVLVDFGNDTSYRGVSTPSPDLNGNSWNSVDSSIWNGGLVDISGNPTAMGLGFTAVAGTDYYNGPSWDVQDPAAVVIDAAALGNLGVNEAAYDYYVTSNFEVQGLDPSKTYNLTFYGAHIHNSDDTTVYSLYTDATHTSLIDSTSLNVWNDQPWMHNQNEVATISGVTGQTGLYLGFIGAAGGDGYLNAMQIEEVPEPATMALLFVGGLLVRKRRQ